MKPRDLKLPFTWDARSPHIQDRVLYVPRYYFEHQLFSMPSWGEIFNNTNPMFCELCSGNGDWVIAQAQNHPQTNWLAVEKRFDRVRKIWSKMKNFHLPNLAIVCGEAEIFFRHYVGDGHLQRIIVNFPDPWPKMRHRKHRLFQEGFIRDSVRVLQDLGKLILATDDRNYLLEAIHVMRAYLSPSIEEPYYFRVDGDYGGSWFEKLWRSKGKEIFYTEFIKRVGI